MLKNETPQTKEAQNDQEIADTNDFWNPRRVRMLAAAVIFMWFLLILGFGLVVYKFIEKVLVSSAKAPVASEQQDPLKLQNTSLAPAFEIDLNGFEIKHISQSGSTITLHVVRGNEAQIWIIDSSAKRVKKIIKLNK